MNAAIESDDAYPFLREHVVEALRHWQNVLQEIVIRGVERGEFAASTNADQVANLLIGGIEGALMMTRALHDPAPLNAMVESLSRAIDALSG